MRFILRALVLSLAAATAACSDNTSSTPTEPTPLPVTETFEGTLTVNGAVIHPFPTDGGAVTVTISELVANEGAAVGLNLGTWNGTSCAIIIAKTDAVQGTTILGAASQSGNLCVYLQDVGLLTAPATYLITVIHP